MTTAISEKVGLDDFLVAHGLGHGDLKRAKAAFDALPITPVAKTPSTDEITRELNETFAVVSVKGQTLILEERYGSDGVKQPDFRKLADFNLLMRNRHAINREGKEVSAAAAWLEHPMRREFRGVVFEPTGAGPDEYNLWQGLSVTPSPGVCCLILHHILHIICNGDQKAYDYVLTWCADMLRQPANRPGVAIAIRGEEGIGKGIFAQVLMKLAAPVRRQHLWPRKGVAANGGIGSRRSDVRNEDETQSLQPKIGYQARQEACRGGGERHSPGHAPAFLG